MRVPASTAIKLQAAAWEAGAGLAELAYELLDAHTDTPEEVSPCRWDDVGSPDVR